MAVVTTEQRARYNETRRRKYAERGIHYLKVVENNKKWIARNKEKHYEKLRIRRLTDPEWREKQNAKLRGRDQRHQQLKTHYGITKQQFDKMAADQGGCCAICGSKPNETLCVDHCHESGKVRSLLCRSCNTGLGCFKEDLSLFGLAVRYLEKWR